MARVRYMVDDVDEAVSFYVSKLGFETREKFGSMIAILARDDLELIVAGPKTSAAQPMAAGTRPTPGGGWARFVLTVDDLESWVSELKELGVEFKNEILEQQGRKQILCVDPSGNVIELFHGLTWVDYCKITGEQPDTEYWIPSLITSIETMAE